MSESESAIRILIADDHALFRAGLRKLLETEPDFEVLGEARNGEEALRLARALEPDVLLLDLAMPGVSGLEALREIGPTSKLRALVLTASIETEQIVQALQLGARGVVLKDAATEILFKSIRAVMKGEYWVGREKVSDLIEALQTPSRPVGAMERYGLTERELQVVAAIVEGLTNREIATKLSISEQTVKHHLTSIFDKVGVSNRLELAVFAVHNGLLR